MKALKTRKNDIGLVLLLIICACLLAVIIFVLAPHMKETIDVAREYGGKPDTWAYYVILAGCVIAFLASLFLIFHRYIPREKKAVNEKRDDGSSS